MEFFEDLLKEPGDVIAAFAALLALISLIVTIVSARSTRKYAKEQVDLAYQQFIAANSPDIEVNVFCQRKNPNTSNTDMGLFAKVTNHSNTITVNQLKVFLISEKNDDWDGFGFIFPTFTDLKPNQTLKVESIQPYELIISNLFSQDNIEFADVVDEKSRFIGKENYDKYPASLVVEYLPRISGADLVKWTREMYLITKRNIS